jgi:hypothetical protein
VGSLAVNGEEEVTDYRLVPDHDDVASVLVHPVPVSGEDM